MASANKPTSPTSSKYNNLTLVQLRNELRKRNLRVSGRKSELIDRLECHDKNYTTDGADHSILDYVMVTPDITAYKDIHSDCGLPVVKLAAIDTYLFSVSQSLGDGPKNLYEERYLKFARMALHDGKFYIKAQCCAYMKKNVSYNLDIILDTNGVIVECQCDCAAGMGPEAHCKHMCAMLYGLMRFCDQHEIKTQETCTQKLQSFNKTPRFKGSPVKAKDLTLGEKKVKRQIRFDPRQPTDSNRYGYSDFVQNLLINSGNSSKIPLASTIPPANMYALATDHDYLKLHQRTNFFQCYF